MQIVGEDKYMAENVPNSFTVGESFSWTKSFSLYPTSSWALTYHFRGVGQGFDVVGTANGIKFELSALASQTNGCVAGKYAYQAFVTKNTEKILVDEGLVLVHPSLASVAANATFDGRSNAQKILDAIDAMVQGKATLDQQAYQIGNRQLSRIPIPDLIVLRDKYQRIVSEEKRVQGLKSGSSYLKTIKGAFVRTS